MRFLDKLPCRLFFSARRSDQIPFVQDNDRRFSRLLDQTRNPFVLCSYAHREIDNENAEVSAANTSLCTHDAENFDRTRMFSTPANSRSVDENELPSMALVKNVNGIAGGSGQFTHNRALAAHNGINKRGFSDVWTAEDRYRE